MSEDSESLAGKLLIAMPAMGDPRFDHSVIYMCAHTQEGALGLIVNKPAPEIRFDVLLDQLGIGKSGEGRDIRVHFGGPCETSRGFVLHSSDYHAGRGTMVVDTRYSMTATVDVLAELAKGQGPDRSMMALGYSGWGPGQLEGELAQNVWLTADSTEEIVFGRASEFKWAAAIRSIGVDPATLSAQGGRA